MIKNIYITQIEWNVKIGHGKCKYREQVTTMGWSSKIGATKIHICHKNGTECGN